jgi:hypothetical protein
MLFGNIFSNGIGELQMCRCDRCWDIVHINTCVKDKVFLNGWLPRQVLAQTGAPLLQLRSGNNKYDAHIPRYEHFEIRAMAGERLYCIPGCVVGGGVWIEVHQHPMPRWGKISANAGMLLL